MLPRGIRNNNPLNIRIGNSWLGEVDKPTDKEFEQFKDMVYGVRAGFILIRRYIERYHLDTIADIVCRWAPPTENNTPGYFKTVCQRTGLGASDKLFFKDSETMVKLMDAMIWVECGCTIKRNIILTAYDLALNQ